MLTPFSHRFAKDIKTALLAADVIINKWGFSDYQLEIYGAMDKTPSYTTDCQEIIATKSLRDNVGLKGEAQPMSVLERTWVFLNSSVSEGLPLALGEAALTGAPVVCTDVGASPRVLTNPEDGSCYSAVVAPNDPVDMARAQIKMLALLEEWAPYADPDAVSSPETGDSSFPHDPTPADIVRITKRMYEQSEARRRLGMRSREIVQKSFSGDRYLREHEQMLWIGKAKKDMQLPAFARPSTRMQVPKATAAASDVDKLSLRPTISCGPDGSTLSIRRGGVGTPVTQGSISNRSSASSRSSATTDEGSRIRWKSVRWDDVRFTDVRWNDVRWHDVRWSSITPSLGLVDGSEQPLRRSMSTCSAPATPLSLMAGDQHGIQQPECAARIAQRTLKRNGSPLAN